MPPALKKSGPGPETASVTLAMNFESGFGPKMANVQYGLGVNTQMDKETNRQQTSY